MPCFPHAENVVAVNLAATSEEVLTRGFTSNIQQCERKYIINNA